MNKDENKKDYDKRQLKVLRIRRTDYSFSLTAVLEFVEITPYNLEEVILSDEELKNQYSKRFTVDFDVNGNDITIYSAIPECFSEDDIKDVIKKAYKTYVKNDLERLKREWNAINTQD